MLIVDLNKTTLLSLCLEDYLPSPALLAATSTQLADQLTERSGPIPLGSRATWIEIQKSDPDCRAVYNLKTLGEAPRKKTSNPYINRIFKESIIYRGLLIVRSFDGRKMREVDKVVIPPSFLDSILTVLHIRLNHPKLSQLQQVFNRYFFAPRMDQALINLYESCHICLSFKKFPKELEHYSPKLFPDHPGTIMNADIVKRADQLILVNIDLFSSYVTTCFAESEKAEDLSVALIQAVTPIRSSHPVLIRVDKAPGLKKLASSSHSLLGDVGINLEVADDGNKNSNCSVDKVICELEIELRKLSPDGHKINTAQLAQATMCLNKKVRNRNLTAAEIHFSRDSYDHTNLTLDDKKLQARQKDLRIQNHPYSVTSKAPKGKTPDIPTPEKGDIVYSKSGISKHAARDPFLVLKSNQQGKSLIRKALHHSPFADMPVNISPQAKLVDNKFLFMPKSFKATSYQPEDRDLSYDEDQFTRSPPKWHPLQEENPDSLIPIILEASIASETYLHPVPTTNDSLNDGDLSLSPEALGILDHQNTEISPSRLHSPENRSSGTKSQPTDSSRSQSTDSSLDRTRPSSEHESDHILTFNNGEEPFVPERLIQNRTPVVGDLISFFDDRLQAWVNARIIQDLSKRWRHYYNIIYEDNKKDGLYLIPDTRWTFIPKKNLDVERVDSNLNLKQLEPTPESSITSRIPTQSSSSSSVSCSQLISWNISEPNLSNPHSASSSSLQWDPLGTELLSTQDPSYLDELYDIPLDQVQNFDCVLPIPDMPTTPPRRQRSLPNLHKVTNLDRVLPLTSTPNPHKQRLSNLRQTLPLESVERKSFLPGFLKRLFPSLGRN